MIEIDKNDNLYKYLTNLGAKKVDELYLELAKLGRYNLKDVKSYFQSTFQPSVAKDVDDEDLNSLIDYFSDLKKIKPLNKQNLKKALVEYKTTKNKVIKEQIINSKLKDVMYLCLNYKTMHPDIDIQDLIQTANLGLMDAINHYDEKTKIDFDDYIIFYVRERVTKEYKEK